MGRNGAVWVTLGTKPVKSPQWYSSLGPDVTLGSFPQCRKQSKSVQNAFLDEICCFLRLFCVLDPQWYRTHLPKNVVFSRKIALESKFRKHEGHTRFIFSLKSAKS